MIKPMCAVLTVLSVSQARAEDALYALMQSQSRAVFVQRSGQQRELERGRRVCDAQLRGGRVPVACFRVLALEADDFANERRERTWLSEVCSERARVTTDLTELALVQSAPEVTSECRRVAVERAADLRYAEQSVRPHRLFRARFHP